MTPLILSAIAHVVTFAVILWLVLRNRRQREVIRKVNLGAGLVFGKFIDDAVGNVSSLVVEIGLHRGTIEKLTIARDALHGANKLLIEQRDRFGTEAAKLAIEKRIQKASLDTEIARLNDELGHFQEQFAELGITPRRELERQHDFRGYDGVTVCAQRAAELIGENL